MRLYSYVVARDFGFAPNPFHGFCTLATCKPEIRARARIGDWVIGTGSSPRKLVGRLVFAMRVSDALSFDDYWCDPRFRDKRPNLFGSRMQAYGDNIYHRGGGGDWEQENSHHSLSDGSPNMLNIVHDTQIDRLLISDHFTYWGASGPEIPSRFREWDGLDVCAVRGHRCRFPAELVEAFVDWLATTPGSGYFGRPGEWKSDAG